MSRTVILVRYGEIGLKGENRPAFENLLVRRVREALRGLCGLAVTKRPGRLLVSVGEGAPGAWVVDAACDRLARVFGVVSFSPAAETALDPAEIEAAAVEAVRAAALGAEATFKVEARRANKAFPMDSPTLARHLGGRLLQAVPGLTVDVHRPEITVHVEVRDQAYVFTRVLPGPGGLPVGASGRAALLLSGGIDSPAAGWMAMKRGLELDAVHFHSPPFTSERSREKVADLCRILARWGGRVTLHAVRFTEAQMTIYERCPAELGVPLLRRLMFRVAEAVTRSRGGLALVTGESLGQVASQTLESIHAVNRVATVPVLRPLIGMDKAEIVDLARRIGTYEVSTLPYEDCCTVFVPRHPRTRPSLGEVEAAEARLDVPALVEGALAGVESEEVGG